MVSQRKQEHTIVQMKGVITYHVPRYLQELCCFHKMFCFNEAGKASLPLKYVLRL